ncbi:Rho termination factor N-terminal domain-containing protein [Microcoleus sp. FACHB-1515]|uniref:Rho termination factor N-terminal domain-containing protein n=1 Tax=Cyanophyceae TaxID=3028117 RepID=UPI001689CFD6|nr:Rho termination factor N-terminal domain-containing protein [Microcoleus sp. FACHB-1515]MBD2093526.1 Rho termination factor N-terminal domain-containing protein [Microcoleus sp. FACHB-1515]
MQLIDICTNAIALFGAAYFLTALTAHLVHCWQHPPVKPMVADTLDVEEFNLLEIIDPCDLLLPVAADVEPIHPFEMSLQRMPEIEPIAADDLSGLSIRELKRIASDRRIPGYSKKTKSELIELLNA